MIHFFSCKNFYSFRNLNSLSFVVNDKAPANNSYYKTNLGDRLSKVATVIGPNASGKTNLLKVLPFLKWLITDSFNNQPAAFMPIRAFMFNGGGSKATELSVMFALKNLIYTYNIHLNHEKILLEELSFKNKSKTKITTKQIFLRKWNQTEKKYTLEDKRFNLPKNFKNLLRPNASVLSLAVRLNHKESKEIYDYWQKLETNVVEAGWAGDHLSTHTNQQLISALDFYSENSNQKIKKEAEKMLSRFDLGLKSFEIDKTKKDNSLSINVKVAHSINNQEIYLPSITYESSGTKQLFVLLKAILVTLSKGGVAVLDEFDVNLHPEIIVSLFQLFIQPETNPYNAQLLFSTHNHLVLNSLDKYQINFTEKNKKGESDSWRLDELVGVRADDNYYQKYLAGAYGAIPKL